MLERYLEDLADGIRSRVREQLPERFYAPVLASLAACYIEFEFEGEEYDRYLAASVQSVVNFTLEMTAIKPQKKSGVLTLPWSEIIGAQGMLDVLNAMASPFSSFHRRFYDTRYDTIYRPSDERAEKRWEKKEEEMIAEMGYAAYRLHDALQQTPYQPQHAIISALFYEPVPYPINEDARFQHTWIISPSGTGKTTLMENLIMADLERGASVVVIDGENQLIPKLASRLYPERTVLVEPDPRYPLALNLFDSEAVDYDNSTELAEFVLGGLRGAELSGLMSGLFRHLALAMTVIPEATIFTLAELLDKGGYQKFRPYIQQLEPYHAAFFENRFNDPGWNASKQSLWLRLDSLLSDRVFSRVFAHPRNLLNLSDQIESGNVVLVNTGQLKTLGKEMFGRYIIAMLMQATEKRILKNKNPPPVYLYLDECHDYIANEPIIARMLDKVRKQKLAMTFAHQRMNQITHPDVKDALTHCRVKFAGRMGGDAPIVARSLRVEPDVLMNLPAEPPYRFGFNQGAETVFFECPPPVQQGTIPYDAHVEVMRKNLCRQPPPYRPHVVESRVPPEKDPFLTPRTEIRTPEDAPKKPDLPRNTPRNVAGKRKGDVDINPVDE